MLSPSALASSIITTLPECRHSADTQRIFCAHSIKSVCSGAKSFCGGNTTTLPFALELCVFYIIFILFLFTYFSRLEAININILVMIITSEGVLHALPWPASFSSDDPLESTIIITNRTFVSARVLTNPAHLGHGPCPAEITSAG